MNNGKEPKHIGSILNQLIDAIGLRNQYEHSKIEEIWNSIEEPNLKMAGRVVNFKDGVLIIEAKSHIWKSELFLRKDTIIEQLNKKAGKYIINEVKIQ